MTDRTPSIFGSEDRDPTSIFGGLDPEKVTVSAEEIEEQFHEWLAVIRAHPAEPILTFEHNPAHSIWDIHVGIIRSDITDDEINLSGYSLASVGVTTIPIVWANENEIRTGGTVPIMIGSPQANKSHQVYTSRLGEPSDQDQLRRQFEVVVGNEAISEWFSDRTRANNPYRYIHICRELGIQPVMSPEIEKSAEHRIKQITVDLIRFTQQLRGIKDYVDSVYRSIEGGPVYDGQAIMLPPESPAEAGMRTHSQREQHTAVGRHIRKLKLELRNLGVDEYQYLQNIAVLLGLELEPVSE